MLCSCSTDAGLEGLAPEVAQQLEEMHVEGPDLCGVAVLPAPAPPGRSCASLMRLGFLGHVSAEHFADPIAAPSHHEEHCQAALYNIVLTSTKSSQAAAAQQSRQRKDNRVKQVCNAAKAVLHIANRRVQAQLSLLFGDNPRHEECLAGYWNCSRSKV